ncbi:hypothetical protein EMPG_10891, partial [Blastomyces silverae]
YLPLSARPAAIFTFSACVSLASAGFFRNWVSGFPYPSPSKPDCLFLRVGLQDDVGAFAWPASIGS